MRPPVGALLLGVLAGSLLLTSSCGSGQDADQAASSPSGADSPSAESSTAFPVTVQVGGATTTVPKRPGSIVSLSPTATEMLYAVDAGAQVKAVDDNSNYPAAAPRTKLSGFQPNVEAVLATSPDLVLLSDATTNDVGTGLEEAGVPYLVLPAAATLQDSYDQLRAIGTATGHTDTAAQVVDGMRRDIDSLVAEVPERSTAVSVYHELDNTLYTATSTTFIGQVYKLAGLTNIADAADKDGADGGYPQLSAEYIVKADPDVIVLTDDESAASVAARPGFGKITAVERDNIIPLDADVASRWGPRVVELLRTVIKETASIGTAGAPAPGASG